MNQEPSPTHLSPDGPDRKLTRLKAALRETGGIAIAFSGGVDSTFLAAVAVQELGARALAVTAVSPTYPIRERNEAEALARSLGIRQILVESDELQIPAFAANPPERCYHCKSELFRVVREIADREGIACVADGTNADDTADYRPGRRAARECRVRSPLLEAGLTKNDIRALSENLRLPTAHKPAFACLASRFPYGTRITREKLQSVDALEARLRELRFSQIRVRYHGDVARIELAENEIAKAAEPAVRAAIVKAAKAAGFTYVALDLAGYRTGSMNEVLRTPDSGD